MNTDKDNYSGKEIKKFLAYKKLWSVNIGFTDLFLTKIEAEKLHREIRNDFPESFVLPDIVDPIEQYSN